MEPGVFCWFDILDLPLPPERLRVDPGWGTKTLQATQHGRKNEVKKQTKKQIHKQTNRQNPKTNGKSKTNIVTQRNIHAHTHKKKRKKKKKRENEEEQPNQ